MPTILLDGHGYLTGLQVLAGGDALDGATALGSSRSLEIRVRT
jgi:hypothetical protein